MKFICYPNKIEIIPLEKEGFFKTEQNLEERGKVISVGKDVKFVKIGDIIYFSSWGLNITPEVEGVKHYVIPDTADFILGKIEKHVAK